MLSAADAAAATQRVPHKTYTSTTSSASQKASKKASNKASKNSDTCTHWSAPKAETGGKYDGIAGWVINGVTETASL